LYYIVEYLVILNLLFFVVCFLRITAMHDLVSKINYNFMEILGEGSMFLIILPVITLISKAF